MPSSCGSPTRTDAELKASLARGAVYRRKRVSQPTERSPVNAGDLVAGKYRVERVLGVGGMGVVVAARHVELGELFALKFLLPSFRKDPEVARRFAREARTGIRVKNEHVARVFDVGTLPDGAPYMVMEHLTGSDVASILEKRGQLPLDEAIDLLLQGCEALCDAHSVGIVHRDLKPANLFVIAGSDGLPFVKVLDFGISKHIASVDDLAATSSATILGSPLYMSPEQLTSSKDVDRRADIWSLGVILYEMVTGRTPFEADSFVVLTSAILGGKFEPVSKLLPGVPPAVDALIAAMLTVDRDARLPSVEALGQRLAPFGTAHARTSSERISRIAARPSLSTPPDDTGASASSVPTVELADGVLASAIVSDTGDRHGVTAVVPSRSKHPPPRGRQRVTIGAGLAIVGLIALGGIGRWMTSKPDAPAPLVASNAEDPVATVPSIAPLPSGLPAPPASAATPEPTVAAEAKPEIAHGVPSSPMSAASTSVRTTKAGTGSTADALTRAFARREADVGRCFDAQAADLPGAPKLAIRFTVDVEGHVKAAQIFPAEVASTPLGQCLAGVARGTEFGPQKEEMSFRIPIVARRGS
jgi:serine/threonine protein kinase